MAFILNKKGVGCSGYLPNSRVITETLSKEWVYANQAKSFMMAMNLDKTYLRDSIIAQGNIDFEQSEAQRRPCPRYILIHRISDKQYKVQFTKCKEQVVIEQIMMVQ